MASAVQLSPPAASDDVKIPPAWDVKPLKDRMGSAPKGLDAKERPLFNLWKKALQLSPCLSKVCTLTAQCHCPEGSKVANGFNSFTRGPYNGPCNNAQLRFDNHHPCHVLDSMSSGPRNTNTGSSFMPYTCKGDVFERTTHDPSLRCTWNKLVRQRKDAFRTMNTLIQKCIQNTDLFPTLVEEEEGATFQSHMEKVDLTEPMGFFERGWKRKFEKMEVELYNAFNFEETLVKVVENDIVVPDLGKRIKYF